ncbi:hypothetical protein GCM10023083_70270 [Streptomyces phyllanthi]
MRGHRPPVRQPVEYAGPAGRRGGHDVLRAGEDLTDGAQEFGADQAHVPCGSALMGRRAAPEPGPAGRREALSARRTPGRRRVPGRANAFAATGHGMLGVTLGPVTGHRLAEYVRTGRRPRTQAPFGFDRLGG